MTTSTVNTVKPIVTAKVNPEAAAEAMPLDLTAYIEAAAEAAAEADKAAAIAGAESWKAKATKAIASAEAAAELAAEAVLDARRANTEAAADQAVKSAEAAAEVAAEAAAEAIDADPTESEYNSALVLDPDMGKLIHSDEVYVSAQQCTIVRYTRRLSSGDVSVLFYGDLSGQAIKPIGFIFADRIKRFSDVRLTDIIAACITKAEGKFCPHLAQQRKVDRLDAKHQAVADVFAAGSYRRI